MVLARDAELVILISPENYSKYLVMANKGGVRAGAGRPRGPSKATRERLELDRIEEQAREAGNAIEAARRSKQMLGRDVLQEFMMLFRGMAAMYQPSPPGQQENKAAQEKKFLEYADRAVSCADKLAEYQSPKFRAIAIAPPPPEAPVNRTIDGNVTSINDPVALSRVYRRMIQAPR